VIGVLATHRTLASPAVARLCERHGADVDIILSACPGLVEEVERGHFDTPEIRRLLASFTAPALDGGADTLVLGCTHYVFLTAILRELVGPGIAIIDSTDAVVREVARRLGIDRALSDHGRQATVTFMSTGASAATREVFARIWGRRVEVEAIA
jgi:glutamate racemase